MRDERILTDARNGLTAKDIFSLGGLTYDDILLLPGFNEGVCSTDISLGTDLAVCFPMKLPLISSPMDTVTEWRIAVAMALQGGIGIIHFNLSIDEAVDQVRRVKRRQMGIIYDPVCLRPTDSIGAAQEIQRSHGFSTVLVTEDGTSKTVLLGMVTKHTIALNPDKEILSEVMIPPDRLVTVSEGEAGSLEVARQVLRREFASKLIILRADGSVVGLVTSQDVQKRAEFPNALFDKGNEQLRVGAAVSTQDGDMERVKALLDEGVDVLLIDSAQGGTDHMVRRIREIRAKSDVPIIAGNVVTPNQAIPLVQAGASALRVGMGSGSICTTQGVLAIGRAQLSAVHNVACYAREQSPPIPIIADGGIRGSSDVVLALACGASSVMVGRLIAGCTETPAEEVLDHLGRRCKRYRGMGSLSAISDGGRRRYGDCFDDAVPVLPQGVEGLVPRQGPLDRLLSDSSGYLRKALEYLGCSTVVELHQKVVSGQVRFERQSRATREEGRPHDVAFNAASWN